MRLSRTLWWLFSLFVIYGATIPFQFTIDRDILTQHLSQIALNPLLAGGTDHRLSGPDAVQNILLFVPFGVFGMLSSRRARPTIGSVFVVTLLGMALSVTVETLQLFTRDRITSTSDVLTDTIGAFLGAIAARTVKRVVETALRWFKDAGLLDRRAFYPLTLALIVVCVAAWEPFDVTIDVSELAPRVRSLLSDPWQFNGVTDEGVAMIQHALLAVALCLWLEQLGRWRAAMTAAAITASLSFALEGSQLFISSRMPGLEDALVGATGAVIGALLWIASGSSRRHALWLALIAAGTAAGAALQMLSPFERAVRPNPLQWLPFLNYYEVTTFVTLSHALELMLIYFPLGFCFAWGLPKSRGTAVVVVAIVVAIAIPIEYLQRFIAGRSPDITDPALSTVGGWYGAWVGSHFRRHGD
jgi:VanZ family protein